MMFRESFINDPYHGEFTDDLVEREIMYDSEENEFTYLTPIDGIELIENIYNEVAPCFVELVQKKQQDLVIKDLKGRWTLLSVLPF